MYFEAWFSFLPGSETPPLPNAILRSMESIGFYQVGGESKAYLRPSAQWIFRTAPSSADGAEISARLHRVLTPHGLSAWVEVVEITSIQCFQLVPVAETDPFASGPELYAAPLVPADTSRAPKPIASNRDGESGAVQASEDEAERDGQPQQRTVPDAPEDFNLTEASAKRRATLNAEKLASLRRRPL